MNKKDLFDAVTLSGGGTKGILLLGVLDYYYEKGDFNLDYCCEYSGTSIGSAFCLLLICGYTPKDIFKEIDRLDNFFGLIETLDNITDIIKCTGLLKIDPFISMIGRLVENKLGNIPTLLELLNKTGKTLYISGSNISEMREEKYSPYTTPHLSCINAVKISCNLPLVFQRLMYNGSYVCDGGLLNNFPIDYISSKAKKILGVVVMGKDYSISDETFLGYMYRMMIMHINQSTELRCKLAPQNTEVIKIEHGTNLLQLNMPKEEKLSMFSKGFITAKKNDNIEYLIVEGWDWNLLLNDSDEWNFSEWNELTKDLEALE